MFNAIFNITHDYIVTIYLHVTILLQENEVDASFWKNRIGTLDGSVVKVPDSKALGWQLESALRQAMGSF